MTPTPPPDSPGPKTNRRTLVRLAAAAATAWIAAPALAQARRSPMPELMEGPFYPPRQTLAAGTDWDADLTQVRRDGSASPAQGEHLALELQLVDTRGRTIDDASVEIWQCDALASYRHPKFTRRAQAADPGFQGYGVARTDAQGGVRFRTIRPMAYPGRTPHIHVKLRHPTLGEWTSQLFVDGDPGNERDFIWRKLDSEERDASTMRLLPASANGLRWQTRHAIVVSA